MATPNIVLFALTEEGRTDHLMWISRLIYSQTFLDCLFYIRLSKCFVVLLCCSVLWNYKTRNAYSNNVLHYSFIASKIEMHYEFNHGRLAKWRKWKSCDVGEAKKGLDNELWRRWSNGRVGEWAVTYVKRGKGWRMRCYVGEATERLENEQSSKLSVSSPA